MTIEELLPWITILGFLFGIAKWLISAASKLVEAITKLNTTVGALGKNFDSFKTSATKEHEETNKKIEDHEIRIHSLEDWKKYHEEEEI